jgi:CRISPR system Cascade subunit CasA
MTTPEMFTFSLIDEPWIPCLVPDEDAPQLFSLRDTLGKAHSLKEIAAESPLVTPSLYRLCLAVLHHVFGPRDSRAWYRLWQTRQQGEWTVEQAAELDAYFAEPTRYRRFDLFAQERPFYQADDVRVKPVCIANLKIEVSSSQATLFDHHQEIQRPTFTPAEAARALVTSQTFGLGGLSGVRNVSFVDGIGAQGIIFLAEGDTLFETLLLNLVPYPTKDDVLYTSPETDVPAWDAEDPFAPRSEPRGYLDLLTWPNRRIMLLPEHTEAGVVVRQMKWAPDLQLSKKTLDPMQRYHPNPKPGLKPEDPPWLPLRFDAERALWRDSYTLFSRHSTDIRPPYISPWLSNLVDDRCLDAAQSYRLMAFGIAKDRANVSFYRMERLPLPLGLLERPARVGALSEAMTLANRTEGALRRAFSELATLLISVRDQAKPPPAAEQPTKGKGKKSSATEGGKKNENVDKLLDSWGVLSRYWGQLETPFWRLAHDLARASSPAEMEGAQQTWSQTLYRAAWETLALAERCAGDSPRALKAAVQARSWLHFLLGGILSKPNQSDDHSGKESEQEEDTV